MTALVKPAHSEAEIRLHLERFEDFSEGVTPLQRLQSRIILIELGLLPDEEPELEPGPTDATKRLGLDDGNPKPVESDTFGPWNHAAEVTVLAALASDPGALPVVSATVNGEDDFREGRHRRLFRALVGLIRAGKPTDSARIAEALATIPGEMIAPEYLRDLLALAPDPATLADHAALVRDNATARQYLREAESLSRAAKSGALSAHDIIERASSRNDAIASGRLASGWTEPQLEGLIPAVPFPLQVLPPSLSDLASEVSLLKCCPVEAFVLPVMTFAGAAIGRSVALQLKHRWQVSPILWTAFAMPAGAGKSPTLEHAEVPLQRVYDEELFHHELMKSQRADLKRDWEEKRARSKSKGGSAAPPKGIDEPLRLKRLRVKDSTWESLGPLLADNPRGLVMVHDELAGWINGFNQYKSGGGNDRDNFMSAWAGVSITIDRKGQEGNVPITIRQPFLAVTGGIQPARLELMPDRRRTADGFLERFLFAYPDPVPQVWVEEVNCKQGDDDWDRAFAKLYARDMTIGGFGEARPWIVSLEPAAKAVWVEWFNAISKEFTGQGFPEHLVQTWSKFRTQCARLTLVLDLLHRAYDPEWDGKLTDVRKSSVEGAIVLIDYFKVHFRRVFATIMGQQHDNPSARAILDWITKGERHTFSEREVKDTFRRGFADRPGALTEGLAWLVERNCLRRVPAPTVKNGRPPTPRYETNPSLLGKRPQNPGPNPQPVEPQ